MPSLQIRNVPEDLLNEIREEARKEHRSVTAQALVMISDAMENRKRKQRVEELLAKADEIRRTTKRTKNIPDSVEIIRQAREERLRNILGG